ncbi:ornithine cyclodeaminase family protein [Anaerosalibacter bizertensis]|uniref:Ornithine cyclodeaminase family protein n=1 Tax=Anaerosalibacter bizertensis TaxID=932217 RepID=A0A844FEV5_9FIRM|nr:ornithine cyclodeaminase family protein [Anaerosalibacter bizertensis]MSS42537.1 ornithine cyclodeaminase family protein [Anaerosalibacter bizertensis]
MLYLNEKDINKCITLNEIMDEIEKTFILYEKNKFYMPDRIHVDYKNKTILYMPCFLENIFGTKFLTVFPENRKKSRPVIDGLMLLNDYDTGETISILDGKTLTALRTGAVGGTGIRHITPKDVKTVGLVGAGVQGFNQLRFACEARDIEKIIVFDLFKEKLPDFIQKVKEQISGVEVVSVENTEELLKESDIVITTTTSNEPVFPNKKELFKGKNFIGIGSYKPNMREYPDALISVLNKVYIDTEFAKEETGDLSNPLERGLLKDNQIETLGNYILYEKNKEEIIKGTTWFKSVGMALFDIVVAHLIYNKAKEKGIGQEIEL